MSYFKNVRSCFDANHNKLSEAWSGAMADWSFVTTNGGTYTSGYDAEDRFRNFIQTAKSKSLYLDRSDIGNITNYQMNSVNSYRSYNNNHGLTSVGGSSQTFNSDGQLTGSYYGHTLSWDEAGMLRQVDVPSSPSVGVTGENRYGYDATQRRVIKEITRDESVVEDKVYIHAGPNLIAEYNRGTAAASPSQEYVYAQEIDSLVLLVRNGGSDKYTITRNQQWSVTALAELSGGTVVERYTYDAFGKRTILAADGSTVRTSSSYAMPFGYTSRQHDPETGLMYFRARYYDPTTGEFTSPDPLEYVDGMSLYRGYFVVKGVDPSGMWCPCGETVACIGVWGPFYCLKGYNLALEALTEAENSGLLGLLDGAADAFRHCVWSCKMARAMPKYVAKGIGNLHEDCGNNTDGQTCMDLWNNGQGLGAAGMANSCGENCRSLYNHGLLQTSPGCPGGPGQGNGINGTGNSYY